MDISSNVISAVEYYENIGKYEIKLIDPQKQNEALKEIEALIDSKNCNLDGNKDSLGNNFFHIISQIPSQKRIIKKLIDKGTNINKKNIAGETPIMSAMKMLSITDDPNDRAGLLENISYMADNGADLDAQDSKNNSVFHYVCQTTSQALLNFMLNKNIHILLKNASGQIGAQLLKTDEMKTIYKQFVCNF